MLAKVTRASLTLVLLTLTLAPFAVGQSAADVLETAMARFEDRMSGIDNYTIVMDVMGFEVTNYFEKEIVDGRPTFVLMNSSGAEQQDAGLFYNGFTQVVDQSKTPLSLRSPAVTQTVAKQPTKLPAATQQEA